MTKPKNYSEKTVASKVKIVATAELDEQVKKELEIPDPEDKDENQSGTTGSN